MRILIHACPDRMWYVDGYLVPGLLAQGAAPKEIEIWNDADRLGNLAACMAAFAARTGDGGTWHLQDDVLPCRDFVERCRQYDEGVVYGFCCRHFTDDPDVRGRTYVEDAWHSFQCVRIPDAYARECAAWMAAGEWRAVADAEMEILHKQNSGDDTFFRNFLLDRHPFDMVLNLAPNLVEHVDFLMGGSVVNKYRGFWARSDFWEDEELVAEFRAQMKARRKALREAGLL